MIPPKTKITIDVIIRAPIEKVWESYTNPQHIVEWNTARDDWRTTNVTNDVRVGGTLAFRMEAKNGSAGFDLTAIYDEVTPMKSLAYTMTDGRKVWLKIIQKKAAIIVKQIFEAETINSIEMQKNGWQAILDNFKNYTEKLK